MAQKRGCFKTGCLGCLGVLALGIVFLAITAMFAWRGAGNKDVVDREISAPVEVTAADPVTGVVEGMASEILPIGKGGKLVLQFSQGEFHVHPGNFPVSDDHFGCQGKNLYHI